MSETMRGPVMYAPGETGSRTILGYPGVGLVEEIGEAVDGISVGDEDWYINGG